MFILISNPVKYFTIQVIFILSNSINDNLICNIFSDFGLITANMKVANE